MALDQQQLDERVADRLAWAGRCASAFAHDLGNVVLFTEAVDVNQAEQNSVKQRDHLLRHYRELLNTLMIWRNIDAERGERMSILAWWRAHSGLMRQFVRRGVSITFQNKSPDELLADATILSRATSAMLLALDLQQEHLERIAIHAHVHAASNELRLQLVTKPEAPHALLLPHLVTSSTTTSVHIESPSAGDREGAITLCVRIEAT